MQPTSDQDVESRIIERLVDDILVRGHQISVWEGENYAIRRATDRAAVLAAMRSTDEDVVVVRGASGLSIGWVRLSYGNGADVIADCNVSDAIDALLAGAEVEAERAHAAGF